MPKRSHIFPGLGVRPIHACSSSRAILAFLAEDQRNTLIPTRLDRLTDRTITDIGALRDELAATRARGYAVCDEEIDEGVTSVAVPVDIGSVGAMLSLGIVGPRKRIRAYGVDAAGHELGAMVGCMSPGAVAGSVSVSQIHDWVI